MKMIVRSEEKLDEFAFGRSKKCRFKNDKAVKLDTRRCDAVVVEVELQV